MRTEHQAIETNLHRRRRRRARGVVAALVALCLLGATVAYQKVTGPDHQREVRELANSVAADLESGQVPQGPRSDDREAAGAQLEEILAGMGEIRPEVSVERVEIADGDTEGRVAFDVSWTVHEGKQPWRYTVQLDVAREGDRWLAEWDPAVLVPGLKPGEVLRAVRVPANRGDILGDGDSTLVTERQVARVGIDRKMVTQGRSKGAARKLARLTGVESAPFVRAVTGAGDEAFVEAVVLRVGDPDLVSVRKGIGEIDGARVIDSTMHLPPTSSFADTMLGRAGPATAEIIEASDNQVREGDIVGISGLQAKHDESLRGTSGYAVQALDSDTGATRSLHRLEAVDGRNLQTTLSEPHQVAAQEALEDAPKASALVAIRPSDGHVLALANGKGSQGQPTANLGQYAPGSTFKVVTALAQLRAGTNPDAMLSCPRTVNVDGRTFKNYNDFPLARLGPMTLTDVVATSCNTALIKGRDAIPDGGLIDAADALGMTQAPALGVPAAMGTVPQPDTDTDTAAASIGQGEILATPLAMATTMASVVAGKRVTPRLLPGQKAPKPPTGKAVTTDEATALRTMLRAVVTDGSATFLADNPGGPILAKTGTAEYGTDNPPRTHAWMIAAQDDLAIAVFVEDGSGGASAAGPIVDDYLAAIQNDTHE